MKLRKTQQQDLTFFQKHFHHILDILDITSLIHNLNKILSGKVVSPFDKANLILISQ